MLRVLGAAILALARCRLVLGAALFMIARSGLLPGIISDVPTGSLQVEGGMRNELVQATPATRTVAERGIGELLERFCNLPARTALILVNRHDASPPNFARSVDRLTIRLFKI